MLFKILLSVTMGLSLVAIIAVPFITAAQETKRLNREANRRQLLERMQLTVNADRLARKDPRGKETSLGKILIDAIFDIGFGLLAATRR